MYPLTPTPNLPAYIWQIENSEQEILHSFFVLTQAHNIKTLNSMREINDISNWIDQSPPSHLPADVQRRLNFNYLAVDVIKTQTDDTLQRHSALLL